MNEPAWKMLEVFYGAYVKTNELLSSELDDKSLRHALGLDGATIYDTVGRLKHEGFIQGVTNNMWRLTGKGRSAWEENGASHAKEPEASSTSKKTMFVEATSLEELQEKVNQRAAEGWAFVSLSVAIAASSGMSEGSAALLLQDMGAMILPRLYVAALQQ